jgi:hypothetical protein
MDSRILKNATLAGTVVTFRVTERLDISIFMFGS